MNFNNWTSYLGIFLMILFFFSKKGSKVSKFLIAGAILMIFSPLYLPKQIFGRWDSIKELKNKKVKKVIIEPSKPEWEVNLTDSILPISNIFQIDSIVGLLKNANIYTPGHSGTIWETKMILIDERNDSVFLRLIKTEKQGTAIYTSDNNFRKDEIAVYLERITNFTTPKFSVDFKKK
jgi:hypothetical protein